MLTLQGVPTVVSVGENSVKLWGITAQERLRRLAATAGLPYGEGASTGAVVLANAAFAWDPAWLDFLVAHPETIITLGKVPVLAHAATAADAAAVTEAMLAMREMPAQQFTIIAYEDGPSIENKTLRKRETPFIIALEPGNIRALERASYFGAYKGVTDLLTRYLWPEWALVLTRLAARAGISPNLVTIVGAAMCVWAAVLFAQGHYWGGMAAGLVFMVFDTVDGKLARCTITSSPLGNVLDHGMDLVHPPFWWWIWATGLAHWGLAYDEATFWWVQGAILGGYVIQRLIEGFFIRRHGMHIHVWRRFDCRFRLITARRNPNMVILFVSMLFMRPDIGLVAVAWWTVFSCLVHAVRLVQAQLFSASGGKITSWLAEDGA